ncbi:helix-turn-helix transcriptional regulator [Kiloniella sp. EL199]|uniref:helix-turn-helix transcriptional regulator n=1 Tax=Kiloniella sp. EL199 TaxID=2107581 RepID=UPI000EA080A3|nr:helix-turn-helix transcriptional regulator [Kiloniella sp. EL199]
MITREQAQNCSSLSDFELLAKQDNLYFYWQKLTTEYVFVHDCMPEGFLDAYYGCDLDLVCPGAWAFRKRIWPKFTYLQAKNNGEFKLYDPDNLSEKHWNSFGIKDCLVILSGSPDLNSVACFAYDHAIIDPTGICLPYIEMTMKLDSWLYNSRHLKPYKREFSGLSPKEKEAIKIQINKPGLTIAEQARYLNISVPTLRIRRERIAKKYGVSSFSSAVLLAERSREFCYRSNKIKVV